MGVDEDRASTGAAPVGAGGDRSAARLLAGAIEPVAGQVHFSPECHAEYVALGFEPSPGRVGLTEMPDRTAYLTSRGSALGQVPGEVVAAAFAVFNPAQVVAAVARGWALTDAQVAPAVAALGGDLDELVAILSPWGDEVRARGGYLSPAVRFTRTGAP